MHRSRPFLDISDPPQHQSRTDSPPTNFTTQQSAEPIVVSDPGFQPYFLYPNGHIALVPLDSPYHPSYIAPNPHRKAPQTRSSHATAENLQSSSNLPRTTRNHHTPQQQQHPLNPDQCGAIMEQTTSQRMTRRQSKQLSQPPTVQPNPNQSPLRRSTRHQEAQTRNHHVSKTSSNNNIEHRNTNHNPAASTQSHTESTTTARSNSLSKPPVHSQGSTLNNLNAHNNHTDHNLNVNNHNNHIREDLNVNTSNPNTKAETASFVSLLTTDSDDNLNHNNNIIQAHRFRAQKEKAPQTSRIHPKFIQNDDSHSEPTDGDGNGDDSDDNNDDSSNFYEFDEFGQSPQMSDSDSDYSNQNNSTSHKNNKRLASHAKQPKTSKSTTINPFSLSKSPSSTSTSKPNSSSKCIKSQTSGAVKKQRIDTKQRIDPFFDDDDVYFSANFHHKPPSHPMSTFPLSLPSTSQCTQSTTANSYKHQLASKSSSNASKKQPTQKPKIIVSSSSSKTSGNLFDELNDFETRLRAHKSTLNLASETSPHSTSSYAATGNRDGGDGGESEKSTKSTPKSSIHQFLQPPSTPHDDSNTILSRDEQMRRWATCPDGVETVPNTKDNPACFCLPIKLVHCDIKVETRPRVEECVYTTTPQHMTDYHYLLLQPALKPTITATECTLQPTSASPDTDLNNGNTFKVTDNVWSSDQHDVPLLSQQEIHQYSQNGDFPHQSQSQSHPQRIQPQFSNSFRHFQTSHITTPQPTFSQNVQASQQQVSQQSIYSDSQMNPFLDPADDSEDWFDPNGHDENEYNPKAQNSPIATTINSNNSNNDNNNNNDSNFPQQGHHNHQINNSDIHPPTNTTIIQTHNKHQHNDDTCNRFLPQLFGFSLGAEWFPTDQATNSKGNVNLPHSARDRPKLGSHSSKLGPHPTLSKTQSSSRNTPSLLMMQDMFVELDMENDPFTTNSKASVQLPVQPYIPSIQTTPSSDQSTEDKLSKNANHHHHTSHLNSDCDAIMNNNGESDSDLEVTHVELKQSLDPLLFFPHQRYLCVQSNGFLTSKHAHLSIHPETRRELCKHPSFLHDITTNTNYQPLVPNQAQMNPHKRTSQPYPAFTWCAFCFCLICDSPVGQCGNWSEHFSKQENTTTNNQHAKRFREMANFLQQQRVLLPSQQQQKQKQQQQSTQPHDDDQAIRNDNWFIMQKLRNPPAGFYSKQGSKSKSIIALFAQQKK